MPKPTTRPALGPSSAPSLLPPAPLVVAPSVHHEPLGMSRPLLRRNPSEEHGLWRAMKRDSMTQNALTRLSVEAANAHILKEELRRTLGS